MTTYLQLKTTFILFFIAFISFNNVFAQCPDDVTLAANEKCVDTGGQIPGVDEITINGITYTWNNSAGYYANGSANGCNNFGVFTGTIMLDDGTNCIYANGVLPIAWGSIGIKKEGNFVVVEWSTHSEINNDNFIIEHSYNGKDFNEIGSINSKGNSNNLQEYSFRHLPQNQGLQYYRIKQVDLDGAFSYSQIESLVIEPMQKKEIVIFPNPVKDLMNIENVIGPWTITNLIGERLKKGTNSKIDIKDLDQGIYFFMYIENGRKNSVKFIKA